jgi:hypothetical protein
MENLVGQIFTTVLVLAIPALMCLLFIKTLKEW